MITLKKKFILGIVSILTLFALLLTGCANRQKVSSALKAENTKYQSSNTSANNTVSTNKDSKSITDDDLLKSTGDDSSTQLDSVDSQSVQLSSDEINALLNENTDLKNISSSFSVK